MSRRSVHLTMLFWSSLINASHNIPTKPLTVFPHDQHRKMDINVRGMNKSCRYDYHQSSERILDEQHYLPLDGMVYIPIYRVWGCWVQLKSVLSADHTTFKNGFMKRAHSSQRMTKNNNNNKRKQA